MVIKVGINGFGRVGRVIFRTCLEHPDVEISAINDPAIEVEYICYLIKFDSTHGTLKRNVSHKDNEIQVDECHIKVFQQKMPAGIPWHTAGVHYVVEASGMFTSLERASGHLGCDGVKRVIITAPSVDVPMVILGVNEGKIRPEYKVISCGSSTLYCLAPIVKVLEDNYGVEEGFITSIHAMTPSLKPLDGLCIRGKHWRDHRSITQNIIPAVTGACRALGRIIPSVRDKICGLAFRVPIANVSVLDFTVRLKKYTSIENIVKDVEKFSKSRKQTIITTSSEESVSSDFIGDCHSCILDVGSSLQLKPNSFKLICWYENEYSYACRVIDLILFSEIQLQNCKNKTTYVRPKSSKKHDIDLQTECISHDTVIVQNSIEDQKKPLPVSILSPTMIPRPMVLRKAMFQSQIPCLNRDPKKLEFIKSWNDENEPNRSNMEVDENTSALLQKYSKSQSISTADCYKAQERLEKVKKEFTKMVSITEDLLRKSYNSKLRLSSLDPSKEELVSSVSDARSNSTSKYVVSKDTEIQNFKKIPAAKCDVSGDGKTSDSTINSKNMLINSSKEDMECTPFEVDQSNYSMTVNGQRMVAPDSTASESLNEVPKVAGVANVTVQNPITKDQNTSLESLLPNRSFISKTFTNLFDGLSKNFYTRQNVTEVKEQSVAEKRKNVTFNELDNKTQEDEDDNKTLVPPPTPENANNINIDKKLTTIQVLNVEILKGNLDSITECEGTINADKECEETAEVSPNLLTSGEPGTNDEGKKTGDVKVDDQSMSTDNNKECGDNANVVAAENSTSEEAQKRECSYTSIPECPTTLLEDQSRCPSPVYRNKQDIFDKLDSASASSSDNSFEVDGRKSQVIKISDLTSSLEDLDRLDKICRIMEISDELSNKLFSALDDSSEGASVTKKKWSFKDLCEKINLDEFCNTVFGN